MNTQTILYFVGSFAIFLGERLIGEDGMTRWALDGLGVALIVLSFLGRATSMGRHPTATRIGLGFLALSSSSLLFYVLQMKDVVSEFGLDADGTAHFRTALQAMVPMVWFVGAMPAFGINRTLAASPHSVHPLRVRAAWESGLAIGLGVSMLFPLNYLAHVYNERWNYSYFKVTEVGEATQRAVDALPEPVRVVLFYPPASEVLGELKPYFDSLEGPNLSVEVMDHAMDPEQAKAWKIRDNGNIAIVLGDKVETIKINEKMDSAKKDLRKLDSKVQASILKLATDKRTVYFTVGHDELYWKNAAGDQTNIESFKKALESLNFKVKELGIDDGLAQAVPDDAAVVFVVGPKKPFFAEEVAALAAFRDQGGALFLMLEPTAEDMGPLAALAGVSVDLATPVVSDKAYLPIARGIIDRINIGTNKYTSHESVTQLSKHSNEAVLIIPGAGSLSEAEGHPGKVTITVKGMPDWFHDLDGDYEADKDLEKRGGLEVAAVATGPTSSGDKSEWRAAAISDASFLSNAFIRNPANAAYAVDTVAWLTADAALGGDTQSEEDVRIQHTKEDEGLWFYGTSAVLPALVFVLGAFRVRNRHKKGAA